MKNNNVKYILRLGLTLFVITALVAAALAGVNSITAPRIAAIQAEKIQAAVSAVLPGGGELMEKGSYDDQHGIVTNVYASENGYAVEVTVAGFKPGITMMVGVSPEGKVLAIQVVSHSETAGLGDIAAANTPDGEAYRAQYVGQSGSLAVKKDGGTIDQLTGATVTSRAVTNGVNAALGCVAGMK